MRRRTTLCQLIRREVLPAIVRAPGLRHDEEKVALPQRLMPLESRDRHAEDRERRVRALVGRHVEVADLRREQLFFRRIQKHF